MKPETEKHSYFQEMTGKPFFRRVRDFFAVSQKTSLKDFSYILDVSRAQNY